MHPLGRLLETFLVAYRMRGQQHVTHSHDPSPNRFFGALGTGVRVGLRLARDYGARLVLLHVAVLPEVVGEAVLIPILRDNQAELEEKLHRLAAPYANLRVEHRFERGDAITEILRVAEETRADLIVLGTHGRTGLGRLLMGSVAEQMVRKASCPVLTVKVPPSDARPSSDSLAEESRKAAEDSIRVALTTPQV